MRLTKRGIFRRKKEEAFFPRRRAAHPFIKDISRKASEAAFRIRGKRLAFFWQCQVCEEKRIAVHTFRTKVKEREVGFLPTVVVRTTVSSLSLSRLHLSLSDSVSWQRRPTANQPSDYCVLPKKKEKDPKSRKAYKRTHTHTTRTWYYIRREIPDSHIKSESSLFV